MIIHAVRPKDTSSNAFGAKHRMIETARSLNYAVTEYVGGDSKLGRETRIVTLRNSTTMELCPIVIDASSGLLTLPCRVN